MKKLCKTLLMCCLAMPSFAQNLVPNPSFEVFDTCPSYQNQGKIYWAPPWNEPLYFTSPDYMNACDTSVAQTHGVPLNIRGFQYAHTGNSYVFIGTVTMSNFIWYRNYREYIQTPLIDSLINGVKYCIRFYVSASDSSSYVSPNIGIYFSPTEINDTCAPIPCNLPFTPQFENDTNNYLNDRIGWTLVSGSYVASGSEKYIIVGNFRDSANTQYIYTGWSAITQYAGVYLDDFLITPCDSLTGEMEHGKQSIKIYPNPSSSIFHIQNDSNLNCSIKVFNLLGEVIFENTFYNKSHIELNLEDEKNGIYFLILYFNKQIQQFKIIKENNN